VQYPVVTFVRVEDAVVGHDDVFVGIAVVSACCGTSCAVNWVEFCVVSGVAVEVHDFFWYTFFDQEFLGVEHFCEYEWELFPALNIYPFDEIA